MTKMLSLFMLLACFQATAQVTALTPPVTVDDRLTYKDLLVAYEAATPSDFNTLKGDWIAIAITNSPACDVNYPNTDWNGVKNADGSIFTLSFFFQEKRVVGPQPVEQIPSVEVLNIGVRSESQGPYKVDSKEPQFSTWGYGSGKRGTDSYFSFSCRLVKNTTNQLVCGNRLNLTTTNPNYGDQKCASDQGQSGFFLFKRK